MSGGGGEGGGGGLGYSWVIMEGFGAMIIEGEGEGWKKLGCPMIEVKNRVRDERDINIWSGIRRGGRDFPTVFKYHHGP